MSNTIQIDLNAISQEQATVLLSIVYGNDKPVVAAKTAEPEETTETPVNADTLIEFRTAAKLVKKTHGEEFAMQVLEDNGTKAASTLGRTISKVDPANYDAIMADWKAGPADAAAADADDLDDDLDADEGLDDTAEVDPEAVKIAVRAYSKANGRDAAIELMTSHGCKNLAAIDALAPAKLAAILAAAA